MQVLVRRELEEAAKVLGERIRTNDASPEVLTRWMKVFQKLVAKLQQRHVTLQ